MDLDPILHRIGVHLPDIFDIVRKKGSQADRELPADKC